MTRDELNLTADETAILDDMVARREATFQKPQYMQSYRATRLKMIAREEIAAPPRNRPPPSRTAGTTTPTGASWRSDRPARAASTRPTRMTCRSAS
jgi:hypothetical protein